jgi:hypothetical protein
LTPNRRRNRRRHVENTDYAGFARRVLAAHGRPVAAGDIEGLPELVALATELDDAITTAVAGLRDRGYSWADIATRLGISRQAAHQRWETPHDPEKFTTRLIRRRLSFPSVRTRFGNGGDRRNTRPSKLPGSKR